MLNGVVGNNNRRKLSLDEFRGFALADGLAPLVFINGADSKAAQMFTLAHQLAHIWINASALSDAGPASSPTMDVERWCNQVAAEMLVPADVLRRELRTDAAIGEEVSRLSRLFKVSTLVVLRRVHDVGVLTRDEFWAAYREESARIGALDKGNGGDPISLKPRASASASRAHSSSARSRAGRCTRMRSVYLVFRRRPRSTSSDTASAWPDGVSAGFLLGQ